MNFFFLNFQTLKKEMSMGNAKNPFYNNFEMQQQQQRRDLSSDQFSMPSNLANVQATPSPPVSNNSAIHNSNYGPAQVLMKQNQNNPKNRFANANAASESYYGSGYFGKQSNPSIDYYGKYEVEFSAHQQKGVLPNQIPTFNQQSKADFGDTKPPVDFHHIKGEIHHGIKPEFVQQQHHKNIEFHHGKAPNFHLNHQNFYNHHGPHGGTNVDGAHQLPMQYNANQYFPNEYGGANELDAPAAYYEQKAASAQQSYYENMYNTTSGNSAAEFHNNTGGAYGTPSNGQLPNEHCDGFLYPQYFDGNHHDANASMQSTPAQQHNHIGQGPPHQNQHYNHGVGGPHYHVSQQHINGNQHISASPMDNSNSSSDFNFLSNIANDFAPEYYQLS